MELNDCILKVPEVFDTFDAALRQFLLAGPYSWALEADAKHAYKQAFVRQADHHLGGVHIPGQGYSYHRRVNFGSRSSESIWERFAKCILALLEAGWNVSNVLHWVDDFFRPCKTLKQALVIRAAFVEVQSFGFLFAMQKLWLGQVSRFMGITFSSLPPMSLSIAPGKRVKSIRLISSLLPLDKWSRKEFQRFAGHLGNFAKLLRILVPFYSRAVRFASAVKCHVEPGELRADAHMLLAIVRVWSGSIPHFALNEPAGLQLRPHMEFWTDASPTWGFGVVCVSTGHWGLCKFSDAQLAAATRTQAVDSAFLEAIPVACIPSSFPELVRHRSILVVSDSKNAVSWLNAMCCPTSVVLNLLFRALAIDFAALGAHFRSSFTPRASIGPVDALSRGQIQVRRFVSFFVSVSYVSICLFTVLAFILCLSVV